MSLHEEVREAVTNLDEQERYLFVLVVFCRTFSAIEQYDPCWPYLWPFRPILVARSEELLAELLVYRRQFEALEGLARADRGEGDSPRTAEFALSNVGYLLTLARTSQLTAHWVVMAAGASAQLMSCLFVSGIQAQIAEKRFQLDLLGDRSSLRRYDELRAGGQRAILVPDHGPVIDYDIELG
jgi:hypothetical protein